MKTQLLSQDDIRQAINDMFDWHGGQSSAFYSFASTRKLVDEKHRQRCLDELNICRNFTTFVEDFEQFARIEALIMYAKPMVEVISYQDWIGS